MGGISNHRGIVGTRRIIFERRWPSQSIQDTSSSVKYELTDPRHRFSVIALCKPRRVGLAFSRIVRPIRKLIQFLRRYKLSSGQLSFRIPCLRNSTLDLLPSTTLETLCLLPELSTTVHFILFQSIILPSLLPLLFDPTDKFHTWNIFFEEITLPPPASVTTLQPAPPFSLSKKPSPTYRTVVTTYSRSSSRPMSSEDFNHSSFKHDVDLRLPLPPPLLTIYADNRNYHRSRPFHSHPRLPPRSLNRLRRSVSHTRPTTIFP